LLNLCGAAFSRELEKQSINDTQTQNTDISANRNSYTVAFLDYIGTWYTKKYFRCAPYPRGESCQIFTDMEQETNIKTGISWLCKNPQRLEEMIKYCIFAPKLPANCRESCRKLLLMLPGNCLNVAA
jgi:hypothetical protein